MENSEKNGYFDANAIKKRLNETISRSGMTQVGLSKKLKISQPTLSKCLNECHDSFFSVEQLFSLCLCLGLSMDEITGLKEAAEKTKRPCLSDVCEALYGLCKSVRLKWTKISIDDKEYTACYSNQETVNKLFTDASLFSKSSDPDLMLDTWKDAFVPRNRDKLREFSFKTREEYADYLLRSWAEHGDKITARWMIEKRDLSIYDYEKKQLEILDDFRQLYGSYQINGYPVTLMYEYADAYIKKNRIPETYDTYYSLTKFKEIYEENNQLLPVSVDTLHTP